MLITSVHNAYCNAHYYQVFVKCFLLALDIPVILLDASSTFVCHFENYVINAHIYLHLYLCI